MLCVTAGAALILALGEGDFSLAWSHSVTHDAWVEEWNAGPEGLTLKTALVKGPGAGLEIPDHAIREAEGWRYTPSLPPQAELILAASGETGGGWQLCQKGSCYELGAQAGPRLRLSRQVPDCASALPHPLP